MRTSWMIGLLLAAAPAPGFADTPMTLPVKGPITFHLKTLAGSIHVKTAAKPEVTLRAGPDGGHLRLVQSGEDRVEVVGRRSAVYSREVMVEVPAMSRIDISSYSGDLVLEGTYGDVRLHSLSGRIEVQDAAKVEAFTVSGDVHVRKASGEVRVRTVSGGADVVSGAGPSSQLGFESTSGDLRWAGTCAEGCRIRARTVNGDALIRVTRDSSFELRFTSHSGNFNDDLRLTNGSRRTERSIQGRYGSGQGLIEFSTFSGDLHLSKR